jgi:hypothetical protein
MTRKEMNFVQWVKEQCKPHGVKCSLRKVKYLRLSGNIKCSGFFEGGDTPMLAVSMNRADWIEILVHEYCHLTQWVDGIELWDKADVSLVKVDDWLSGKNVRNIDKHLAVARDLELDNEKRSVALIKEWGLNVDLDCYIKKANAYIQFYNHLGKTTFLFLCLLRLALELRYANTQHKTQSNFAYKKIKDITCIGAIKIKVEL